jgi:hypothetical protein
VAAQRSAGTFVVNKTVVFLINPDGYRDGKIATNAKSQTVSNKSGNNRADHKSMNMQ